jgi:hypothetical protein
MFSLKCDLAIFLQEIRNLTWACSSPSLEPATPIHKAGRIAIHRTEKYNSCKNTMIAVENVPFLKGQRGIVLE